MVLVVRDYVEITLLHEVLFWRWLLLRLVVDFDDGEWTALFLFQRPLCPEPESRCIQKRILKRNPAKARWHFSQPRNIL